MSANIRYPNITSGSEREQLAQIKSYLRQLADELNYILSTQGTGDNSSKYVTHEELKKALEALSASAADT